MCREFGIGKFPLTNGPSCSTSLIQHKVHRSPHDTKLMAKLRPSSLWSLRKLSYGWSSLSFLLVNSSVSCCHSGYGSHFWGFRSLISRNRSSLKTTAMKAKFYCATCLAVAEQVQSSPHVAHNISHLLYFTNNHLRSQNWQFYCLRSRHAWSEV